MGSPDLHELLEQHNRRQLEDIIAQFNILSEWVDKNFSDVQFSVEFNDDSRNPILPQFIIRTRLFTGMDITPKDRYLKKTEHRITKEIWSDTVLMNKWIKNIVPSYQKSITKEVNAYYAKNKQTSV